MTPHTPLLFSRAFLPRLPELLRTRIAICASFFIQGAMFATWCSRIPDVKTRLALDDAALGLLLLLLPIGEFLSIFPNGFCVTRFGSKRMAILAGFLYPTLLIALGFANSPVLLGVLLFFTGAIANLSNTAVNTQGVHLEQRYGRSIMALFHGMWSVAGLFAVSLATLFAQFNLSVTTHFCCLAIGAALLLSFSGGALADEATPHTSPEKTKNKWLFTPAIVWLGIACFGCMACEGTVYNWSSVYMHDVLHASPTSQNLAYLSYLCTMVTGRFIIDLFVNRLGIFKILFVCGCAITVGLLLIVGAPWLPLGIMPMTLIGFAIVGCGASAVVPLCCSLTGRCKAIPSGIAIAEISTIGFFGLLLAPPLTGVISKAISLPFAFFLMALISLPVLLAIQRLRKLLPSQEAVCEESA